MLCRTDADECVETSDSCDLNADCLNTVGSFTCTCKPGYSGTGIYCTSKQSYAIYVFMFTNAPSKKRIPELHCVSCPFSAVDSSPIKVGVFMLCS